MKAFSFRCKKCNLQGAFRIFNPRLLGNDTYITRCRNCHHVRAVTLVDTLPRFQRPLGSN